MAFSPTLEMCQITCSKIRFTDTTGLYHASNNTGGWLGPNINAEDVTAATIVITDSDGDTEFTYDVLSQIPDPVSGDITYTDYSYALADGTWTVTYTITTSTDIYTHSQTVITTCNFECCISKQLAKIAKAVCENPCNTSLIDDFLVIEGMLFAYKAAGMCEKVKTEMEKRLQRFCDYQCDC